MILMNMKDTYPGIAASLRARTDVSKALQDLSRCTGGDWPDLSDRYLREHGDYLLSTYDGIVVATYRPLTHTRVMVPPSSPSAKDPTALVPKIRFDVEPALEMTWLIGQPQPGGPLQRGEARGTRKVATPPERSHADYDEWLAAVRSAARTTLPSGVESVPTPAGSDGVEVAVRHDGALVITVPADMVRTVLAGGGIDGLVK